MSNAETPLEIKGPDKPLSPELEKRQIWVQAMGVTGVGKTTFVKMLGEKLGLTILDEPDFTDNPLFPRYYDNPEKYALPFQMMVLYEVHKQLTGGPEPGINDRLKSTPIASEPPVQEHRLYATARFGDDPSRLKRYEDWYDGLFGGDKLQKPDLLVYLRVSFEKMLRRIQDRAAKDPARARELQEKPEYWKRLWGLHEEWVRKNSANFRILTINTDIYDFNRSFSEDEGKKALLAEFLSQARYCCVDPTTGEQKLPSGIVIPEAIIDYVPKPIFYS